MTFQPVDLWVASSGSDAVPVAAARPMPWPARFVIFKRLFDMIFGIATLPLIAALSAGLVILNPFLNPGPLFFFQTRVGRGGQSFTVWKFRTMTCGPAMPRGHDDRLEEDRITPLGTFLRRARLDEVPNFVNVLLGDMSVIGPRPDMIEHARAYSISVPRYRQRFRIKPGITGLAQVRHGYVDDVDGVLRKARNDQIYIDRASVRLDFAIAWQTLKVILSGHGAR